jgi:hypothetical protein
VGSRFILTENRAGPSSPINSVWVEVENFTEAISAEVNRGNLVGDDGVRGELSETTRRG